MKQFPDDAKPDIEYPTQWSYTVIGPDRAKLESVIADTVAERDHQLELSKKSSEGKYTSLKLDVVVQDEKERLQIFEALRDHPDVKIVL